MLKIWIFNEKAEKKAKRKKHIKIFKIGVDTLKNASILPIVLSALVAELVDATDSKSVDRKVMLVQVRLEVPKIKQAPKNGAFFNAYFSPVFTFPSQLHVTLSDKDILPLLYL